MLKSNKKFIIALTIFFALVAIASAASVVDETYRIPGGTIGPGSPPPNDWLSYARFLFPFAISVAAVLSVIMLVLAGLEMMTASESMRSDAKEKIQNALIGLAIALGTYLILNTINPNLLNLRIDTAGLKTNSQTQQSSSPSPQISGLPAPQNPKLPNPPAAAPGCPGGCPAGFSCFIPVGGTVGQCIE